MQDATAATRRSITLDLRDTRIRHAVVNPITSGATLQMFNPATGESVCLPLPGSAGAWRAAGPSSWKYQDRLFLNGPCKAATVSDGRLTVKCMAKAQPIQYSLDEPSQGALSVRFTVGALTYCAQFGGIVASDSGTDPPTAGGRGTFLRYSAAAPSECPAVVPACP